MVDVSIIIVCMNKLQNLYPCLDSIKRHNSVSTETIVTAYMFTPENLAKAESDYPWVQFIENNEIAGFSANNNIALRQAKGKYCFILNDDTVFEEDVVGELVRTFDKLNDDKVAIVSPNILLPNGDVQFCGRYKSTMCSLIMANFHLRKLYPYDKSTFNQKGIFKSYNVLGAAFMIKTDLFKSIGWFDEYYFFSPEDIAVSTMLNRKGYTVWVNADIHLTHLGGGTIWSPLLYATAPAGTMGLMKFHAGNSNLKELILRTVFIVSSCLHWMYNRSKGNDNFYKVRALAYWNTMLAMFGNKSPKELFIKHYNRKY